MGINMDPQRYRRALLAWYDANHRDYPWRGETDPYRIWVSEAMLQQTRVQVVAPRYLNFLSRFPTVRDLADADIDDVVATWSGLGYYSRARNLHAAARVVAAEMDGAFPRDLKAAQSLPGVGPYMSRAILSIAYGTPAAVVDGNVARVISRTLLIDSNRPSALQQTADILLDPARPGDANQATMDLGATICTPVSPACAECPIRQLCGAHIEGKVDEFPPRKTRPSVGASTVPTTIWVSIDGAGQCWLERRTRPPLAGLWMFPWRESPAPRRFDSACAGWRHIGVIEHAIMNRRYRCEVLLIGTPSGPVPGNPAGPGRWVDPEKIPALPHSSLLRKSIRLFADL
jgi:A/G-specific adenine glycosylase